MFFGKKKKKNKKEYSGISPMVVILVMAFTVYIMSKGVEQSPPLPLVKDFMLIKDRMVGRFSETASIIRDSQKPIVMEEGKGRDIYKDSHVFIKYVFIVPRINKEVKSIKSYEGSYDWVIGGNRSTRFLDELILDKKEGVAMSIVNLAEEFIRVSGFDRNTLSQDDKIFLKEHPDYYTQVRFVVEKVVGGTKPEKEKPEEIEKSESTPK